MQENMNWATCAANSLTYPWTYPAAARVAQTHVEGHQLDCLQE